MRVRLTELIRAGDIDREALNDILRATSPDDLVHASYAEFDPTRVKELLVEIVAGLNLQYIVIFIDEWMHLKRCQVEFAERLRQCMFGTDRISIKIAADQYQGKFNNAAIGQNIRGLEPGADIMVKVDLDHPFRGPAAVTLYTEALYRRLLHLEPNLAEHFGYLPLRNPESFILSMFQNMHAFEEVCRGAQGLCREFHEIFKDCASAIDHVTARPKLIDYSIVQRVLVDRTKNVYRSIKNPTSNTVFSDLIVPHVRSTGSQFFLADSINPAYGHIIDDLHSKRVIHGVPMSEKMDPVIKAKYEIYEIEYGIYLEMRRTASYNRGAAGSVALEDITAENCDGFTLDFSLLSTIAPTATALLQCVECGYEFPRHDRYYVVAGICPNPQCLLPQEGWRAESEEEPV